MSEASSARLTLDLLPDTFAICRLDANEPIPAWATARPFFAVVRTPQLAQAIAALRSAGHTVLVAEG